MCFAVVVDVEVVKNSKLKNSNPLSHRSTTWHPITQPQPRDHRNPIRRIQQNPQVHPSALAKITLCHRHSLIGVGRPYFGVGTVTHSHILLRHSYPLSISTLRYPHQYISTPNTLISANIFSSLIPIACGQSIFSPGEMMSMAALYTMETRIQRIQGSHKTSLSPIGRCTRPKLAHSAEAILSLGGPPSTLPTVNQGPANPQITTHSAN
jgi:hypothetical protein